VDVDNSTGEAIFIFKWEAFIIYKKKTFNAFFEAY